MSFDIDDLPAAFIAMRERWADRNERMSVLKEAVTGEWAEVGPDDEVLTNRSPNLIQVALEDTAEAASMIPTPRVKPSGPTQTDKDRATAMERMAIGYMDLSQVELLEIRTLLDLAAYGVMSWVVVQGENGVPAVQWRDPETCYPEPGFNNMDSIRRCVFARNLYVTQLPIEYQRKIWAHAQIQHNDPAYLNDKQVQFVEWFDEDEYLVAVLYQAGATRPGGEATYMPIELDRFETVGGVCPVIVNHRIALDNEPRGQFDQVINVMQTHIRLMAMVLDYADQSVYSDVWVKDLVGAMPMGGGSYIQLGPNGQIGRVAPAVSSLQVFEELDQLIENVHLGGRWPKVRPGQVDQAIASAKFVEATAGMMNTVIRTYHLLMKRQWEQALRVCFLIDKTSGPDRTIAGVLRNQQFLMERKADDIDLEAKVRVEFGLGLGRDVAQSMVLGIQASQAGFVSREFVQENFEGITDVDLERIRLDVQAMRDMALGRLMQGLESGEIPPMALVEIAQARQNGDDIFELFKKYIAEPQSAQQANMLTSGIDGSQVAPGPPALSPAATAPAAPPPEALLASLAGGAAPAGPPESIGRLSVPLGGGGFAGTQSSSGPR
jgi:hypothetical protein